MYYINNKLTSLLRNIEKEYIEEQLELNKTKSTKVMENNKGYCRQRETI